MTANNLTSNLESVHASVRAAVGAYAAELGAKLGARLKAVSVYGSATGPDYIPGKSNVNIVAVVDPLDAGALEAILGAVKSGMKKGIVAPLLVTPEYIRSALDVFPIEFLEIQDTQALVRGEDCFSDLPVSRDRLRLECESQLRASVLRTRQAYLELGLGVRGAERVLHTSITALIPVFKAVLRLRGEAVPRGKVDIVQALGVSLGVGVEVFIAILRDRSGDERILGKDAYRVLAEYIDSVEAVTRKLEGM
jgi:hypothetical protein